MAATASILGHDRYWDPAWYDGEQRAIFGRCWIYLGLRAEFAGKPVICDLAGAAVAVSASSDDRETTVEAWRGADPAVPVRAALCGQFVFACLAPEGETLEDYLAPYAETLARISEGFVLVDNREQRAVTANWKTLIENTLDDYHVPAVHGDSFKRRMHPDWPARMTYERHGRHSVQQWDLNDEAVAVWARLDRHARFRRYSDYSGYRHYFIFPNFYVSTAYGTMAVLHRILPIDAERSTIEWSICLPLIQPESGVCQAIKARLLPGLIGDAREIVLEDLSVCELAQRGRHFAAYPGVFGGREARLVDFQRAVAEATAGTVTR